MLSKNESVFKRFTDPGGTGKSIQQIQILLISLFSFNLNIFICIHPKQMVNCNFLIVAV